MRSFSFAVTMLLLYIFNAYIIFWYGKHLFDYKKDGTFAFVLCLLCNLILWVFLLVFFNEILNVIMVVLTSFIIFYIAYQTDFKLSFFHAILYITIMFTTEYIGIFLFTNVLHLQVTHFKTNVALFLQEALIGKILLFLFLAFIVFCSEKKENRNNGGKVSLLLTILPVATFVITVVLRLQSDTATIKANWYCVLAELLLVLANFVTFAVHEKALSNQKKISELQMLDQKQTINMEYLNLLERKDEETHIFIHDIKNNLINLNALSTEQNVKDYITSIYHDVAETSIKVRTKNKLLDVILNKYDLLCREKEISFETEMTNENLSFLENFDLSAIMDNILSNAIESASLTKKPFVYLSLEQDEFFHKIILQNSCLKAPRANGEKLITNKRDKAIHGYGMRSVERAVEKYNGQLMWGYETGHFKISILIPR